METYSLRQHTAGIEKACIWMQAGVVDRKACYLDYDCPACRFDKILQRTAEENRQSRRAGKDGGGKRHRIVSWKEKLLERPAWRRPCLHHMKGRINFRACTGDYHCGRCEFDQYFHDQYSVHALMQPIDVNQIDGFRIPQGYYLHRGHAWVKVEEGSQVRVGLDDFALRLLGPLSGIQSPLLGKTVRQDRPDISIQRGDLVADMLSPVSGVVTSVNAGLREDAGGVEDDPYAKGWVVTVHADQLRLDLKRLMIGSESEAFLKDEIHGLYKVIEQETGCLDAADGGQLGGNIYSHLPGDSWRRLTRTFLRT